MKVTIFGATGPTGQIVTQLALDQGHKVTALVRTPSKMDSLKGYANLKVIKGDATHKAPVQSAVEGADVVISCLGHVPRGPCPMMSLAFRNIITASAQQASPPRCVLMSTIGVGGTSCVVKTFLATFLVGWKVINDYDKADSFVRNEHGKVPFVLVRPGHLTDGPATLKYKITRKGWYHLAMTVSRSNVAHFILRAASTDEFDNMAVQLH